MPSIDPQKIEGYPRFQGVRRFLEKQGEEPCHVCGVMPGAQHQWFCSYGACENCQWKEGKIIQACPEHKLDTEGNPR